MDINIGITPEARENSVSLECRRAAFSAASHAIHGAIYGDVDSG